METVKFFDAVKSEYELTTNHAASSYNQPVLIQVSDRKAFGPKDFIVDRYGEKRLVHQFMADSLFLVDPAQQDCDTIKKFNSLAR